VKVLDFGIAKQIGAVTTGDKPSTFMTQQGVIIGTIHYMSPEQALGKQLDARSDIFSLGVVLYEAATGRLPFRGETVTETMTQIIRDEPAEPRNLNPAISAEMQAIIDRCLRKNREERYATAEELVAALDAQLGRASTAPYTSSNAPTVARAAATVSTASSVKTVQESAPQQPIAPPPPQKRVNVATIVIIVALAVAVAALAIINRRNAQAANTTTVAAAPAPAPVVATQAPPPQPPTSTTVEVEEKKPAAAPPIVSAPAPAPAPVPEPVPAPAQTPDTLYATAVSQLQNGDAQEARKTLLEVVKLDPHYARAHFRLGEIALLNRRGDYALQELYLAQNDPDKLDPRERMLTDLGTAVVKKDREAARHLAREINTQWPDDPDLAHIVREYPGMFLGGALREERGPFRGRRRPGQ